MMARVARVATTKIPWDKIVKAALPVLIEHTTKLLSKMGKRRPPGAHLHLTPETKMVALEKYVEGLEEDLKETVKTLEDTAKDLSALAAAGQILTARITISLFLSGSAGVLGLVCLILILLHK